MDTRKLFLFLAVGVLMAGISGMAAANDSKVLSYDAADYSPSADPSWTASGVDASGIREPMETGSVPTAQDGMSEGRCCGGPDEVILEFGASNYRHGIDDGP